MVVLGRTRDDHGRGSSQWWPTGRPNRSLSRKSRGPVEVGHLHVRRADRVRNVRVAARAGGEVVRGRSRRGAAVQASQRCLGVDDFDRVDQSIGDQRSRARPRRGCDASGRTDAGCRRSRPGRGSPVLPPRVAHRSGFARLRNSPMISPAWVRSSSPTITRHDRLSARSTAPLIALWSVMHSTSIPASTTAAAISSGVVVESPLHIVWLCMSTRTHPVGSSAARCGCRATAAAARSRHERQRYPVGSPSCV